VDNYCLTTVLDLVGGYMDGWERGPDLKDCLAQSKKIRKIISAYLKETYSQHPEPNDPVFEW
jgi:hypothetical protein